ncbi:ABC transporter permease [Fluviicola chungangensis]|uniref:ABC transporter permease n=1 Tax=Fluviicola chungangensis TaxID=2597671 RepID=A0A556N047_9FLAO|nr:FtsX-like permease family protein [Fluviicola chungangensis]TSJ45557.1 ABC transporter permease [Fluviicola chungangensis]
MGIAVITAALVIILSAFNGIEQMVSRLYSDYDPSISMRSLEGKTFDSTAVNLNDLRKVPGVISLSKAIEETVIIKHGKKWINARMVGVDYSFTEACNLEKHLVDGYPYLEENGEPTAVIGASLLDKIDGYISEMDGYEELTLYTPLRDASIARLKSPFKVSPLKVVGRMNFNKDVNMSDLLVPINYAEVQLNYGTDITAIYFHIKKENIESVKEILVAKFGKKFLIKTAAEKNELIFKTSESEKKIVVLILLFIFILAAFNLVASLNMLFIEKKENIETMERFGATKRFIFQIFFFEGILIAFKGILIGLVLGVGVCLLQMQFVLLQMPNSGGEAFPMILQVKDVLFIFAMVVILSVLSSYFPVRYLVKRTIDGI